MSTHLYSGIYASRAGDRSGWFSAIWRFSGTPILCAILYLLCYQVLLKNSRVQVLNCAMVGVFADNLFCYVVLLSWDWMQRRTGEGTLVLLFLRNSFKFAGQYLKWVLYVRKNLLSLPCRIVRHTYGSVFVSPYQKMWCFLYRKDSGRHSFLCRLCGQGCLFPCSTSYLYRCGVLGLVYFRLGFTTTFW